MANTFIKIGSTVTVGAGGTSGIQFTGIVGTYTDLCLKLSLRSNYAGVTEGVNLTFNSSVTGYTYKYAQGAGSGTPTSSGTTGGTYIQIGLQDGANNTASTFGNMEIYIPSYSATTLNKVLSADSVGEENATTSYQRLAGGIWTATSAITQIDLVPSLGTLWVQYSTASLYGIKSS
jgi:hypothetical protein